MVNLDLVAAMIDPSGRVQGVTWQWYALWALLLLNVTTYITIILEADPIASEVSTVAGRRRRG